MSHEDRAILELAAVRAAGDRIRMIHTALEADPRERVWSRWDYGQEQEGEPARRSGAAEAAIAFGVGQRARARAERSLDAAFTAATGHADREAVQALRDELRQAWADVQSVDAAIRSKAGRLGW
jgi:hypothetical protein